MIINHRQIFNISLLLFRIMINDGSKKGRNGDVQLKSAIHHDKTCSSFVNK